MSQQKPPLIVKSSLSTAIFDCEIYSTKSLFNVNCQAELGKISQRHNHANQRVRQYNVG